jgi:hypothetical protein
MTKSKRKQKPPHNQRLTISPTIMDIFHELDTANDRTTAIVGAAFVENGLALVILSRLRILDDSEQKQLFDNNDSVLATFAGKIDMGFALNIYGKLVRDDLHNIRAIRNRFAHHLEVRDFDHPEVAGKCDNLNGPKYIDRRPRQAPRTRRDCYTDTVAHFGARFDLELKERHTPPEPIARIVPDY